MKRPEKSCETGITFIFGRIDTREAQKRQVRAPVKVVLSAQLLKYPG